MKDLNEVDINLHIKVRKHKKGFALCQSYFIEKVLKKFNYLNIKEANTQFDVSFKLTKNTGKSIAQIEYATKIGSLICVMHCTRPNIVLTMCKLFRYTSNPSMNRWKAIIRVLGYLKKTMNFILFYNNFQVMLKGYIDASSITSASDNKLTFEYIFNLKGSVVSWASKKQTCIIYSIIESKFITLAALGKEPEWLRKTLLDIKLWPQLMQSVSLYYDSQITISSANYLDR